MEAFIVVIHALAAVGAGAAWVFILTGGGVE